MSEAESVFGSNAFRACQTEVVLPLLKNPLDIIRDHCPDWTSFVALVSSHSAVQNACRASANFKVNDADCRYAVEYNGTSIHNSFSNRFDQKLYESFQLLIESRKDATTSREEHEAIMATRPPPTPPAEEFEHEEGGAGGGDGGDEDEYDEDGNLIERDEYDGGHQATGGAAPAQTMRPRKTRAQRREEENQKKEDAKRQYEVEVKEHKVVCLEQKLANALCANAIRVALAP